MNCSSRTAWFHHVIAHRLIAHGAARGPIWAVDHAISALS
jgi:hypothetical protein